jgi:hypothetical protein
MRTPALLLAAVWLCLAGTQVEAQVKRKAKATATEKTDEKLKELGTKVEEALKGAADSASALKTLQDLQAEVAALKQEAALQKGKDQGFVDLRRKLDLFDRRVSNLELQLSTVKIRLTEGTDFAGYKEGKGFYLRDPKQRFVVQLGAYVQATYLGQFYPEKILYLTDKVLGQNVSTFLLSRAVVALDGNVFGNALTYGLMLDFGSVEPGPILDAWGQIQFFPSFKLRFGRQRVPFGRQMLTDGNELEFVDRIGATTAFTPGWDLGLTAQGDLPLLNNISYQIGLYNGAGSNATINENTDFIYAARVVFEPLGKVALGEGDAEFGNLRVSVGGSFFFNLPRTDLPTRLGVTDAKQAAALSDRDRDDTVDNVAVYSAAAELAVRMRGMALQGEFFFRHEDPGVAAASRTFFGAYGQYSMYLFSPFIQIALRYGFFEPNYYGLERATLRPDRIHEIAAVANLAVWKRRIKIQFEYSHQWQLDLTSSSGAQQDELRVHQFRTQLQFGF